MKQIKNKFVAPLVFVAFLIISLIVHRNQMTSFPNQLHAWAHCDHYAISKGFIDNGFDFFHPQTYVFNKQFPDADGVIVDTNITSVDFPINNYIVAIAMKITGDESPVYFRSYMLLLSCIGLTFLFLIAYHFSGNYLIAFAVSLISTLTPIYLDYQIGFLPSMSALSIFYIASYFLIKHFYNQNTKTLLLALFLFSIAALMRTPFVIFLIAYGGYLFVNNVATKKVNLKHWLILITSIGLPALYFIYNSYLRSHFGSIFLASTKPPKSAENFFYIIDLAKENWFPHYFNELQYLILYAIIIIFTVKLLLAKVRFRKEVQPIFIWLGISTIGVLMYMFLMLAQLINHDYYIIDTIYPVVGITLIVVLSRIKYAQFNVSISIILLLVFSYFSIFKSYEVVRGRRVVDEENFYYQMYLNYSNAEQLLAKHEISKSEKIMVIDAYAPNMPFLLSGYKGYALLHRDSSDLEASFQLDYTYFLMQQSYFAKEYKDFYSNNMDKVKLVDRSGNLILLHKIDIDKLDQRNEIIFSDKMFCNWENAKCDTLGIGNMFNDQEFGLTYSKELLPESHPFLVKISGEIMLRETNQNLNYTFTLTENDSNIIYLGKKFDNEYAELNKYHSFNMNIYLPTTNNTRNIKSYFYSPGGGNDISFKNIKIEIY